MIRAFLFDMDGVLINSEELWHRIEPETLRNIVPNWNETLQKHITGMSSRSVHVYLQAEHGVTESFSVFEERYREAAKRIYSAEGALYPGVHEAIATAKKFGWKTAICSSSPTAWIQMMLEHFALAESFDVIVSADLLGGKGKPAPDVYVLTCRTLGVTPAECITIEDSKNGIASAQAAGIFTYGFRNGFNTLEDVANADRIITDFSQIVWNDQ